MVTEFITVRGVVDGRCHSRILVPLENERKCGIGAIWEDGKVYAMVCEEEDEMRKLMLWDDFVEMVADWDTKVREITG
jgi:hypothetical protein